MSQTTSHAVAVDSRTHGLADDQPDMGRRRRITIAPAPNVNDDVGLCRADPVLHRRVKLR